MSDKTTIEWTDATWNPIRGCSRVSEGCRHCYAEGVAMRFSGPGQAYEGLVRISEAGKPQGWNGDIKFVEHHLLDPLKWTKPRRIFVNSMSDLFHPNVPERWRDEVRAVQAITPRHTYQVLTKRPETMCQYESGPWGERVAAILVDWLATGRITATQFAAKENRLTAPLPNVQNGTSVEDQDAADKRIPWLLQTPAAVRFLSMEPLLGQIKLREVWTGKGRGEEYDPCIVFDSLTKTNAFGSAIDWVIVGGESGRGARPMHPDWARSVRDQCAAAGVPFFFKQWGEWEPQKQASGNTGFGSEMFRWDEVYPDSDCLRSFRVGKKPAGHLLDGVEHHAFPEER